MGKPEDLCIQRGWYWYCDTHDSHGVADEEAEAEAVANAHVAYKSDVEELPEDLCCDIAVFEVRPSLRPVPS
jgi:hypothetical protein